MWPEETGMTKVLFDIQTNSRRHVHNIINPNMVKKAFINNNTFSGCLHSRGMVQPFHLDLQDNICLF